ncbi:vesicle-trafficking protein SEC22c isoform X2 [Ahaetulla prasina]|uniref:vesicle-trafficking protein SEC22c isoform X2 n=1 Tax=Ahaetulla prasina TaxID=499056 RepID=UPI0026489297|nr:vesicle-trafficking protein SEC22c isoform X2 [Ahaetulla prasina]
MSMILFTCVVRIKDGLHLSASSDFHLDPGFLQCRKKLNILSSVLTQYPERGTAKERDLSIYFHTSGGVSCLCIAVSSYPAVMAFCFLEEIRSKFAMSYNATCVSLASRPYTFLEFDRVIQKTQNQFNDTNCAQPKCDVAKMQEDLHLRPPALVSWEDMELVNGMVNGRAQAHLEAAPACRMQPVSPLGILSLILNIMCGALNLIRGVHLAEYSWQEDHEGMINVVAFLLPFMSCFGLCYLYLFYTSARKIKVSVLFVTLCLCNVYLYGLRNHWQILFHVAVASLSSHQILTRQVAKRPPDLGV